MTLAPGAMQTLARLTQLQPDSDRLDRLVPDLNDALALAETIRQVDAGNIAPLISPLEPVQRLRADVVSESDQRDRYQQLAPAVEDGLYLVPKVLD